MSGITERPNRPGEDAATRAKAGHDWLNHRIRLAALLCEAAELEHALVCKYLFAAFSLKQEEWEGGLTWDQLETVRAWKTDLLLIARQEMEHLALVCNLLTAIGESPYLRRPNFPVTNRAYPLGIEWDLEGFGPDALQHFIEFEMPTNPDKKALAKLGVPVDAEHHTTIGALYREIRGLFEHLATGHDLFVGPASAQLVTSPSPSDPRGLTLDAGPLYQVLLSGVQDVNAAKAVIDQIIAEGEGTDKDDSSQDRPTSHFGMLCRIYRDFTDLKEKHGERFDPARRASYDPVHMTGEVDAARDRAPEPEPPASDLITLFDLAYETLIVLLARFIAHSQERPDEAKAIQHAAFFPMMTAVIRPLGEIMTLVPVVPGSELRAAPGFRFDREVSLLPHPRSAAASIAARLDLLASLAERCARSDALRDLRPDQARRRDRPPADVRPRLRLISENLARVARDFQASTGGLQ